MKWAIELSEYDVEFIPRQSIKGQAAADFVAELTGRQTPTPIPEGVWTLHVDGSAMDRGCGAGVLLISPEGERTEYALRFGFPASNNEAEYEALLVGLRLANEVGTQRLQVRSDSLLIVSQVSKDYQAKDERMTKYLAIVQQLIASFTEVQLAQIPRSQNSHADVI